VLEEIQNNSELKKLRVAFLIDEAHRSQEGQMGAAIRLPFRKEGGPDDDSPEEDLEEQIAKIICEHDLNQLFVTFAEWVGPQLIKTGTVSDLMKQIRATVVTKAAVQYQGVTTSGGPVKLQPGKGKGGIGPVSVKSSVQDMIADIQTKFQISDEEALYIKQVTEEKIADPAIGTTVQAHRDDRIYLEGPYRGQVNGDIQTTYDARGRYNELGDPKYIDTGGIFDIIAVTVIQTHLSITA
jgi:type I restriction enzyme, R subunit